MVGVVSGSLYRRTHSLSRTSGLVLGRRPLDAILHSSNEPGELSQWLCHDDSTINIVVLIIIIIIIIITVQLIGALLGSLKLVRRDIRCVFVCVCLQFTSHGVNKSQA